MSKRVVIVLVVMLTMFAGMVVASPTIVINEIMYNPNDDNSDYSGEWIELYNPNSYSVPIGGWTVKYDKYSEYTFPANAIIPANGYIVVSRNTTWFQDTYGRGTVGSDLFGNLTSYRFSNTGTHSIALVDSTGTTVDNVTYNGAECPEGYSLEKKDPLGSSDATGSNWACSEQAGGTPLEQNTVYVPFFGSYLLVALVVLALVAKMR